MPSMGPTYWKELVKRDIGDPGVIELNLSLYWIEKARFANNSELRYLHFLNRCLEVLIGNLSRGLTVTTDDETRRSIQARVTILEAKLGRAREQIKAVGSSRGGRVGVIKRQAIVESPPGYPDANSTSYRGDPNDGSYLSGRGPHR